MRPGLKRCSHNTTDGVGGRGRVVWQLLPSATPITVRLLIAVGWLLIIQPSPAAPGPRVASLNLCTDSMLLEIADPAQIISLSALSLEQGLSNYADRAATYPINYGSVEAVVAAGPDLIVTGRQTSPAALALLKRLGYVVAVFEPVESFDDYRRQLKRLGALTNRNDAATALLERFNNALTEAAVRSRGKRLSAVVYQANGFSPGKNSLVDEILRAAGVSNLATSLGIDRGGFIALEQLVLHQPDIIIHSTYAEGAASLANLIAAHPAIASRDGDAGQWRPHRLNLSEKYWSCANQMMPQAVSSIAAAGQKVRLDAR